MSQPVHARLWSSELHRVATLALTIALLHFGGNFRNAISPPEGSSAVDLDLLLADFDAIVNVVLEVVL
jgi:hypothetical protein